MAPRPLGADRARPDGDKKDWLEFAAGRPDDHDHVRRPAPGGQYSVAGQEVQLNYKVGNQSVLITLTYGPDKAQLYARSARTGYTAVYEKRP